VQYKLGLAQYHAGRAGAALEPLRRAVAMDPRDANAAYTLGLTLRDLGRTKEAIAVLNRTVALSPAFAEPRAELAAIYASLGRTGDEIDQLEALAALAPSPERAVAVGLAYARAGRTSQAVVTLGNAAERFPDTSLVYLALGRVWLQVAQARDDRIALRKALGALEGALTASDPTSETLALFGRAVFLSGDIEAAEQTLLEAVARVPVSPMAFVYLADAAERLKHTAIAKDALVSYRALLPDSDQTAERFAPSLRIADLAMRSGDPATGVRWYRRASDSSPSNLRILQRLTAAAVQAGETGTARAAVERALMLRPRDPSIAELARRLQ
jgi:tetratricopeptide (TPR) repeat protein